MDHQVDTSSITWMVVLNRLAELEEASLAAVRKPGKNLPDTEFHRGRLDLIEEIRKLDPAHEAAF